MGNQRGTLLKQADQHRTAPYWAEMWAISGENVGRIWDPYENGGQKPYGPIWVAHMGPI